jgi:hypothetical protein
MVNRHARELGKVGAAKGGAARAQKLDAESRQAIAREAALARWGNELPMATHTGELVIAGRRIACAVINTPGGPKRLLTQETFLNAVGRARKAKGGKGSESLILNEGLPPFLAADNLMPFVSDELREESKPIVFRTPKGGRAFGYDAMLLPMVCEVYLKARDEKRDLPSQRHIVRACDLLTRGLARVGIIALVDEATGFQEQRAKDELTKILEAYISAELMRWTKMFPDDFFRHIYRLQRWEFRPGSARRTPYVGKLINKYVYEELPPGVLPELQRLNPRNDRGYRRHKHFQFLTADTGNPHLDRQITAVLTIMRISDTWEEFEDNFKKAFAKSYQTRLPLVIEV